MTQEILLNNKTKEINIEEIKQHNELEKFIEYITNLLKELNEEDDDNSNDNSNFKGLRFIIKTTLSNKKIEFKYINYTDIDVLLYEEKIKNLNELIDSSANLNKYDYILIFFFFIIIFDISFSHTNIEEEIKSFNKITKPDQYFSNLVNNNEFLTYEESSERILKKEKEERKQLNIYL